MGGGGVDTEWGSQTLKIKNRPLHQKFFFFFVTRSLKTDERKNLRELNALRALRYLFIPFLMAKSPASGSNDKSIKHQNCIKTTGLI